MSGFRLETEVAGGGTALSADWSGAASAAWDTRISDMIIIGYDDPGSDYWNIGISLTDAQESLVENVRIAGKSGSATSMSVGVDLNDNCTNAIIDRVRIINWLRRS